MLASELIKYLQNLIKEHGDHPIIDDYSETYISAIVYDKTEEANPPEAFIISFMGMIDD